MAIIKSSTVLGTTPAPQVLDATPMTVNETVSLIAAQSAINNVVELAILPAGCVPISYVLDLDDLDSNGTPTITADLGIINAAETAVSTAAADGGAKWLTANTAAQNGGIVLSNASKAAYDILKAVTPVDYNRIVGIVFPAGAATGQAGKARLEFTYAAAR